MIVGRVDLLSESVVLFLGKVAYLDQNVVSLRIRWVHLRECCVVSW